MSHNTTFLNKEGSLCCLKKPWVMGILNVTPNSFSDGGCFNQIDTARAQVDLMLAQGADIIDIGGESTRPGANEVDVQEEMDRVLPIIEMVKKEFNCKVSLDTSKAEIISAGASLGIDMVNDVRAGYGEGVLDVVAKHDLPIVMMHMQGQPKTMQKEPHYNNLLLDIKVFFQQVIDRCQAHGIKKERLILDPGFGFGKTSDDNLTLIQQLGFFNSLPYPILIGLSRKSTIGEILNAKVDERLYGTIVLNTLALQAGAKLLRVHDVAAARDAILILEAIKSNEVAGVTRLLDA